MTENLCEDIACWENHLSTITSLNLSVTLSWGSKGWCGRQRNHQLTCKFVFAFLNTSRVLDTVNREKRLMPVILNHTPAFSIKYKNKCLNRSSETQRWEGKNEETKKEKKEMMQESETDDSSIHFLR